MENAASRELDSRTRPTRRRARTERPISSIRVGAVLLIAVALTILTGAGSGSARAATTNLDRSGAGSATNLTTVVDLNGGQNYLALGLSYDGFYNVTNTSFPDLLNGTAAGQLGFPNRSVLELAPQLNYMYGHDSGLVMFDGGNSTQWEISADAVTSAEFNGDGVSFYFMLTPVSTVSWSPDAYVATVAPGGSGIAPCSGDLIFPFSTTPYVVVQWEPAYVSAYCAIGYDGEFNVFEVAPGPGGVVNASSITTVGPIGNNTTFAPGVHDVFNVTASFNATSDELREVVADASVSTVMASVALNLTTLGDAPLSAPASTHLAVAESSSERTGWGLTYVGDASSPLPVNTTLPPPGPTPVFTANYTTVVNLNGGQNYLAPGLSYNGFYNLTNLSFPVLLTANAASQLGFANRSVLELAPQLNYTYGHDTGLVMFDGGSSAQWELSADAVTSNEFNGDGVAFYFMLTPVSTLSWNQDVYVANVSAYAGLDQCSGDVIFPYSTTPYFVVQWEPAYQAGYCGQGSSGEFNVFSVNPPPSGVVSSGSIVGVVGPIGNESSGVPGPHDVFNVTVGYRVAGNEMEARVVDTNTSTILSYAALDLAEANYLPPDQAAIPAHLAVAGGASDRTGWGITFAGYSTWTETNGTTPPGTPPDCFLSPTVPTVTSPTPLGSGTAARTSPLVAVAAAVSAGLAVSALAVVAVRRRRLRREGEELVAGMSRLISEGDSPRRPP